MIALPLISKIAGGAALVAIATLTILWQLSERRADRLAADLLTVQRNLNTCRDNVENLTTSLKAQNQAVERLRDEGAARVAETAETLTSRDVERAVAQARAQWLRERPIAGVTECERLTDVVRAARGRE